MGDSIDVGHRRTAKPRRPLLTLTLTLVILLAGCDPTTSGSQPSVSAEPSGRSAMPSPSHQAYSFPIEAFAALSDKPVSNDLAGQLQAVLEASADGGGLTAAVISPQGSWSGATGLAVADRQMVPNDQLSIASITKTFTAAQVMQLIEAGELSLPDLAADRLPADLVFDSNHATIEDLLSMRSGISEYFADEEEFLDAVTADPLRVWTTEEKLATVDPHRGPVGPDREWEYIGTNYLLLGLIIEEVTGRSVGEALRSGVLSGDGFERIVYQPDERPTSPMALPQAAAETTLDENGGFLPSLANVTLGTSEGAIASDALSLARWFRALCAGQIVTPASVNDMTDFGKRPEYGLGIFDRRYQYGGPSGALGHTGFVHEGGRTAAICFQDPVMVVVGLSNVEHDIETTVGNLWRAASE